MGILWLGTMWLDHAPLQPSDTAAGSTRSLPATQHELFDAESEALLFTQADRVDRALSRLGPRELGPSTYFLGFAGYGEEKVFAEEIRFAAKIMDNRFGGGQRTLFLLNDVRDRERTPLASGAALRHTLQGLAEQMQLEHDLLIVALSSHGGEDATLAVSNGNIPLTDLTAEQLRTALDGAGIRWRLLIVSACFAGSFIDSLADQHTAIITAAAADRSSFGCSNDRDLTYFGEAFYRDALPSATSIRGAFENAKALVTVREQAIGVTPSLPAMYMGSQIEAKLAAMSKAHQIRSAAATRLTDAETNQ
ncbi:MAG: C13 family peptidase [Pseudomonadales bacterium]